MKRSLWMLLSLGVLLGIVAACSPAKPPKNEGGTDIDYSDSDFTPETCAPGGAARRLNFGDWSAGMPASPEEAVVIIDPGHGGRDGGACIGVPGNGECPNNVFCASELKAAGASSLVEAELTFATATRLRALLQRLGFQVALTRTDGHGKRGLSVSATMSGQAGSYQGSDVELALRGWSCNQAFRASGKTNCPWPNLGPKSRVSQILEQAGVPLNSHLIADPRVAYISLHFDSAPANSKIGPIIMAGKVRSDTGKLVVNPALGGGQPMDYTGNYVRFLADRMVASVRQSGTLDQFNRATEVDFEDGYAGASQSFSFQNGPLRGSGLTGEYKYRRGNFGTVSVVSGVDGVSKKPKSYIASIPQNLTFEVANIRDCGNVVALARSVNRGGGFDAHNTPLDPADPLDVAALDIAHGLVEYYASYVPEFKERACENLKASDWVAGGWKPPSWCGTPEIDAVTPSRFQAELRVGSETQTRLSFENIGDADLIYRVSATSPLADLGPPTVVPAAVGGARPLGEEQTGILPPGHRAELEVTLRCPSSGRQSGTITIFSNDPDESRIDIPIELNCLPVPELAVPPLPPGSTALNYLLPADAGTGGIASDVFDFAEAGGEAELHYRLTLPDWLHLSPTEGTLPPGGRYLDQVDPNATVRCDAVGEREGVIVIETDDPRNPRVEVPVRLMCAELEAEFQPADYNPPGTPLPERCPPLSGTIRIRGADHLQEMYAESSNGGIRYRKPEFTYVIEHPNYTTRRWPILHAPGDPASTWDWSAYPNFAFTSFVQSCAFDLGEHTVNTFDLVHPRWQENPPDGRGTYGAHLTAPTGFTIHDNRFPGVIYDHARLCDDQGNCTEYDVDILLSTTGFADQSLSLEYGSWDWALHPLAARFQEEVTIRQGTSVAAEGNYLLGPIFDPTQLRYCRILKTDRLRDHTGGYLYPPGMPPVFWGQTVELVEYAGSLNVWLVEAMHEPICYDPWDPGAGPRAPWANQTRIRPTPTRPLAPTGEGHFRRFFDRGQ